MSSKNILSEGQFMTLVQEIKTLIEEGRQRATRAANQELVRTYWRIGKRIAAEGIEEGAGYSIAILHDLADALNIEASTLRRAVKFFYCYDQAPRSQFLKWSHYKRLVPITNIEERNFYERLAEEKKLTHQGLGKAIRENRFLEYKKTTLLEPISNQLTRPTQATYVYKALVERVIDGDTILLRIDLGFQVWKEQRIRLINIDTPPLSSPEGKKVHRFVLEQLAQVEFVMVKTHKIDVYGRYLGHIFYSFHDMPNSEIFLRGDYLNQDLVDRGHASIV